MRRPLFGFSSLASLGLAFSGLALSGCTQNEPDRVFPVFFTPFSAQLDTPAASIVAGAATVSKRNPSAPVEVIGYADAVVGPISNASLSQQRADVVTAELIRDGVPGSQIVTKAGGVPPSSQPGVKDRRAEIDVDLP